MVSPGLIEPHWIFEKLCQASTHEAPLLEPEALLSTYQSSAETISTAKQQKIKINDEKTVLFMIILPGDYPNICSTGS